MHIIGLPRGIRRAAGLATVELSTSAKNRLHALDVWRRTGQRTIASEVFGLSPATLYRWRDRFDPTDLTSLEARSRRPRRVRQPTTPGRVVERIKTLREQYPRWGREKLRVLLAREAITVSAKTIDRVLRRLKARGLLVEPPRQAISARKRHRKRPYAIRCPPDYRITQPGDLVEVDTLDVRPLPGVILKHFTARDVISRWDGLEVYSRATATTATQFLESLQKRLPFPIRAIQVDGGSEFAAAFEATCQHRGLRLFVLPPRCPQLNGHVERAQRTHTEEFYECYEGDFALAALRPALRNWEHVYNTVRPHQSLGYLTPAEYLAHHAP
jgi:putative transposase